MDDLDRELERRGHRFCRYADDCNIYVRSLAAGQRVMESVVRFLEGSSGCASTAERAPSLRLGNANSSAAPKSITRAKEKIRQITRRNRGVSLVQVIIELNLFLVGWLTFCRYAAFRFELQCLDEWIRRKLRCYRLKQCKRGSTIAKLLQRLGASPSLAHRAASSGKGWWRLSLTRPVHQAMSQEWFAAQGLVSLLDKYDALRH